MSSTKPSIKPRRVDWDFKHFCIVKNAKMVLLKLLCLTFMNVLKMKTTLINCFFSTHLFEYLHH